MMKHILILFLIFIVSSTNAGERTKFMIFADLHHDLIPDGEDRLQVVVKQALKQKADFIIDLGDFALPSSKSSDVREILDKYPAKVYHTLGNHDVDKNDKQTYVDYWNMPAPYYYFDTGSFRFIILDSNFFLDKDSIIKPYEKGNYGKVGEADRNFYSQEEVTWLKKALNDTTKICILFSHAPVNDQYSKISQNKYIHDIIIHARDNGTRIAAVFGGHIHSDNYHQIDGVNYIQVNSISYIWGGSKFTNMERYPESIYREYPSLKYTIPFEKPLYAVVEICSSGKIKIKGTKSRYVQPEPDEKLLKEKPYPCSPVISDRKLTF
ncbi:MAG: metallophosphoesterase [Bacteroidales bacterium]|nr:metallophosphoesterase [Bacteroidales bacterium]